MGDNNSKEIRTPDIQVEQESQSGRINISEGVDLYEPPEAKAIRLLQHVKKAEFDVFGEYSCIALREGGKLVAEKNSYSARQEIRSDDIVSTENYKGHHYRAVSVCNALEDMFGYSPYVPNEIRSKEELLCAIGKQGDNVIIQGGGHLHRDASGRLLTSAFKLIFDSNKPMDEFISWLQENPNQALSSVLERAIGKYTEDGEFQGTLLPQKKVSMHESANPFAPPIKAVNIKLLDSGQEVRKNLEDSEVYKNATVELKALWEAELKLAQARSKPQASTKPTTPKPSNNPSGLNPDAPLTKLINFVIKPFIRNK